MTQNKNSQNMHMFQRREDWIQFVAAITCKTFKHKACSIVVVGHPFHQKYMFQLPSYWESLFFWQIVFWCKHARLRHLWENMFHIKKLFVVSAPAQLCCCFNLGEEDLQAQLPFKKKKLWLLSLMCYYLEIRPWGGIRNDWNSCQTCLTSSQHISFRLYLSSLKSFLYL